MKWYRNLKVGAKLLLSFAVMSLIVRLVGYVGVHDMGTINDMLNSLYEHETLGISRIKGPNSHLIAHQRSVRNLILSTTDAERKQRLENMKSYEAKLLDEITMATPLVQSEKGKQLLSQFWPAWQEYQRVSKKIVDLTLATKILGQNKELVDLVNGSATNL